MKRTASHRMFFAAACFALVALAIACFFAARPVMRTVLLPSCAPYAIADSIGSPLFRWKDASRRYLLANIPNPGYIAAAASRDEDPAAFEAVQKLPPAFPVIEFDLDAHVLRQVDARLWTDSTDSPHWLAGGAPFANHTVFGGLIAGRDQGYVVRDPEWRKLLISPVMAGVSMLERDNRQFVAVLTADGPKRNFLDDYRDRHGPFYLQFFDDTRVQIGPTFRLEHSEQYRDGLSFAWVKNDSVLVVKDMTSEGRWWVLDMNRYQTGLEAIRKPRNR